jgi:hypothetical protein
VAVVGLGTIGVPTTLLLALAEVDLVLVDGDRVEEKNLARQLFRPGDIDRPKADCAAAAIRGLRPGLAVEAVADDCRNLGAGFYRRFATLFGCVDSLAVEGWLGDMAQLVGATLIRPATTGRVAGNGSVTVRRYPAGGACPQCWWGTTAYAVAHRRAPCDHDREVNPSAGVFQTAEDGFLGASLGVKAFLSRTLSARKLQFRGGMDVADVAVTAIESTPECAGYHSPVECVAVALCTDLTLGDLFCIAARRLHASAEKLVLETHLQPVVVAAGCRGCTGPVAPSFLRYPRGSRLCPHCGGELVVLEEADALTAADHGELLSQPLRRLHPPPGWGGVFRAQGRELLVHLDPQNATNGLHEGGRHHGIPAGAEAAN